MTKQDFQTLTQNVVLLDGATGSESDGCRHAKGRLHRGVGTGT